jgi:aryl-alcohol dehydrogenase-like predicted oxidoreductase
MFPAVLETMARRVAASQQSVSDAVRARLHQAGYPKATANGLPTLSQMSLSLITQLAGVSSVLVGMRRPEYVEDSFGATQISGLDSASILNGFSSIPT